VAGRYSRPERAASRHSPAALNPQNTSKPTENSTHLAPAAKATKRPSPLRLDDAATNLIAGLPALSTLTRWIEHVARLRARSGPVLAAFAGEC
jgi:hypothetical protein